MGKIQIPSYIRVRISAGFDSGLLVFRGVTVVPKWLLPTVSEIVAQNDPTWVGPAVGTGGAGDRAQREWRAAIAALTVMLKVSFCPNQAGPPAEAPLEKPHGMVVSGPLPVVSQPEFMKNFLTWTLTTHRLDTPFWMPFQLLPAAADLVVVDDVLPPALSLLPGDPLAAEQFCLILTPRFSLVMVLGPGPDQASAFRFSFLPEVVERAWEVLRPRVLLTSAEQVAALDDGIRLFPPAVPDYQTVMQFSRLLLAHLPEAEKSTPEDYRRTRNSTPEQGVTPIGVVEDGGFGHAINGVESMPQTLSDSQDLSPALDVELLQALAHEIRTPLTTIRTLTRLLLKRKDLHADVSKRLGLIDRECSEQIDRFGLIFRAVELETTSAQTAAASLTRTSLVQMFEHSIPRWQQQASQRNLTLEVVLPQRTPTVVSDPSMLDQALTSLIERFTRSLPAGSHIRVEVTPAGNQLKVQLRSQLSADSSTCLQTRKSKLRSLGQVLMFQPETGSLSLNMAVTKNLFHALGGKLIVRHRPEQGEVMTVFLPLDKTTSSLLDNANILDA
jgi:signal transduction histidine kinase